LSVVSGAINTDGTDGAIKYTTVNGDLSEGGLYRLQAKINTVSGIYYSDIFSFQVIRSLS
jgi:hypothetical protein